MKKVLFVLVIVIVFMIGAACGPTNVNASYDNTNEQNDIFDIYEEISTAIITSGTKTYPRIFTDSETGVNYIVVINSYKGDIAITPRLNADGSLYVSQKEYQYNFN